MSRKNFVSCLTAIIIALTLVFSSTQTAFANEEADKHNVQGEKYYNEKKYDEAIKEFNAAIAIEPNTAGYHSNLGAAYLESKNYEAAITECQSAIAIEPNTALYHNNLGVAYSEFKIENYKEAISELNTAINLDPNEPLFYYNRAKIYNEKGQHEEWNIALDESKKKEIEVQEKNEEANESLFSSLKRNAGSVSERMAEQIHQIRPFTLTTYEEKYDKAMKDFMTAGKMYFNKKDYDKAKDAFNRAIIADDLVVQLHIDELNDKDEEHPVYMIAPHDNEAARDVIKGEAYFWLGEVESRLTEKNLSTWQDGIGKYDEAVRLGFVEDFVFIARGRAKYELKDYQAAVKDLTTAIEIDATHAEAYKWRAETYFNLTPPDFEKARDDFQKYLDFDGKNLDEETKAVYEDKIDKCEKAIRNNSFAEKLGIGEADIPLIMLIVVIIFDCIATSIQRRHAGNFTVRRTVIYTFIVPAVISILIVIGDVLFGIRDWMIGFFILVGIIHIIKQIQSSEITYDLNWITDDLQGVKDWIIKNLPKGR